MRRTMTAFMIWIAALAAVGQGCSTNPATGKSQLNAVSARREISLGAEAAPGFLKEYGGEVGSVSLLRYVSELGGRLAAVSERPDLPWEFHVVDSEVINAFALPGGKVFVSRGLLSKLDNEAQLAGVLGHEVGHVTAQHIGQQMTQAMIIQGVAVGLGVAGEITDREWLKVLGVGSSVGGTVYLLSFGRDQELEADALGVRYMAKLGYNPVGQLQVMEILAKEASGGSMPEFLSTHPLPTTRIERLKKLIRGNYPNYEDPAAYRYNFEQFKEAVTAELNKLPPAKHSAKSRGTAQSPVGNGWRCCDLHSGPREPS